MSSALFKVFMDVNLSSKAKTLKIKPTKFGFNICNNHW